MKIEKSIIPYLTNEKFSNGLNLKMSEQGSIFKNRIEALVRITNNKNVIHFGCADHPPLIESKFKNNKYLHAILDENTKHLVGLDYNPEGIDIMKNKLNMENVYLFDLFSDTLDEAVSKEKFDYILLGEILEHVNDPVSFLKEIKIKFKGVCDKIIITVPNIACKSRFNDILNDVECINTDHRYWFTPFTLAKVLTCAGYLPLEINGADIASANILNKIALKIKEPKISNCETLVAIAEI
ncbi:methyltransferase domain-containing protein [Aliivibrio fischeri]|uniref:methyltransferase domain-containing protein n=1 Tax=Aliivibrio fischeri TaxID=668 RepID=UPI0007C58322|nr:methyltransferase domain-containing protein [Aliivibrio fischeri]